MATLFFASNQDNNVTVRRRRRGSGPQGRAETPNRETPRGGSGGFSSSGGGTSSSGGGGFASGGGRGVRLPAWAVILLVIVYIVLQLMGGGSDSSGSQTQNLPPAPQNSNPQPQQQQPVQNFTPPAASNTGETWLVMLYQDADDQILERDIYLDLNEAERVGSSDQVHVVAQIDRYRGAYSGDGNWTSTRRYYITHDNDLETVNSQMVADLGEVDMSNAQSLVDFVTWAAETFPADHYVLILSDHGMGWPGGWTDPTSNGETNPAPLASRLGSAIYLDELDNALAQIRQQSDIQQFDIIGMDACLMAQVEVMSALAPHAHYFIASEETEPALGWAYTGFLQALVDNPGMSPADLSKLVVQSYIDDDQRIVDARARADLLQQGSPLGGLFGASSVSASELARQMGRDITLSVVDLSQTEALLQSLNDFTYQLQNVDQAVIASARNYAQSFTSVFGQKVPPAYIDLGNFVAILLRETADPALEQTGQALLQRIQQTVIAEKHGAGKRGATGLAIYFPNTSLYRSPYSGPQSYTSIAVRFAQQSLWDDFLAFHYNGQIFSADSRTVVVPDPQATGRAPGAGRIQAEAIIASSTTTAPNQPVRLSTQISGQNIGYIFWFAGYYDPQTNSIFVADTDYLESPDSREVGGVTYPRWPQGESFGLDFTWNPTVFAISDGDQRATALFNPLDYGANPDEAVYTVDGIYTFAQSGDQLNARLYFQNGKLVQVFGFTGSAESAAPREITPQPGDTFTLLEKWLDLDASGGIQQVSYQEGETFTFGAQAFQWEELYAAQGEYMVGFIITDMDGNGKAVYTRLTVR
ncbi:MAG: hypothetical protein Fur0018_17770 [Anaerolineales bacterium]